MDLAANEKAVHADFYNGMIHYIHTVVCLQYALILIYVCGHRIYLPLIYDHIMICIMGYIT